MTKAARIPIARVYDAAATERGPGARVLVDRVWPRGIRKVDLAPDAWIKDVAPSTELRKWFGHDPALYPEFRSRYRAELDANTGPVDELLGWCRKGPVTLLYSAHDREHNQAVVLSEYLDERLSDAARG